MNTEGEKTPSLLVHATVTDSMEIQHYNEAGSTGHSTRVARFGLGRREPKARRCSPGSKPGASPEAALKGAIACQTVGWIPTSCNRQQRMITNVSVCAKSCLS